MEYQPPRLADRFLEFFCKGFLLEEIQGDLFEFYQRTISEKGRWKAGMLYWYHVFNFVRPFAIKKSQNSNFTIMLKYNFLIAFRNLKKQRFYSLINISGLAIAIACCLFITVFIKDELNFDKHWKNQDRISRMSSHILFNENEFRMASSPAAMKEALKEDLPEVEESGRFRHVDDILMKKGDEFLRQGGVAYADASILNIFKLDFIYGGGANSLETVESMIISRSASEKFFGFSDPVGQMVETSQGTTYRVDGVYNDIPYNSHFHFDVMLSMEGLEHSKNKFWLGNNYQNYFLLKEGADVTAVNERMEDVLRPYLEPNLLAMAQVKYDDFRESGGILEYFMIPITDIHFDDEFAHQIEVTVSKDYIYIFSAVGLFILLLACINFMNLSTAKSASRAKEVGMRKVMGSVKKQLVFQFLTESILISLLSFMVAIIILHIGLSYFNDFTSKTVFNPLFGAMQLWPYVLLASLIIGVLAGVYPAFYLSRFKPVKVLKGDLNIGMKSGALRNILVVIQFTISIVMIMGTGVVYKQLKYSQNKRLGYDKEQVLILANTHMLGEGLDALKNDLLQETDILDVTSSHFFPTRGARSDMPYTRAELDGTEEAVSMQVWGVDDHYISTLGMTIVDGRNFDKNRASDSTAIILNQTAVKRLGLTDPIGAKIRNIAGQGKLTVIGVVEDFFFDSYKQEVWPLLFYHQEGNYLTAVKFKSDQPLDIVEKMEGLWDKHAPGQPFEYSFMDQEYEAKFREEERLGMIFGTFSTLAICIACLGLFALAAFTAEQRRKEIGIRKVLGASINSIVSLLFSSFFKLLSIAILLAVPIGYLLMNRWLDDFVYRTSIGIWLIVGACATVFVIAWLTIGFQSLRAAKANPTDNLHVQ